MYEENKQSDLGVCHGVRLTLSFSRDLQQSIAREPSAPSIPPPAYQSSPAGGHATAPTPAPRTMPVSRPGLRQRVGSSEGWLQ